MPIVSGLFDSHENAAAAIARLQVAGIGTDDLSVIAHHDDDEVPADRRQMDVAEGAEGGAGLGALLGGAGGLLAGLGIIAVPGIGPVLAGGWLLATAAGAVAGAVVGATAGGIVGALVAAGIPGSEAHFYAESIRRGGTLVSARVDDAHEQAARVALTPDSVDVDERRSSYEDQGWSALADDPTTTYDIDGARARNEPILPPFI